MTTDCCSGRQGAPAQLPGKCATDQPHSDMASKTTKYCEVYNALSNVFQLINPAGSDRKCTKCIEVWMRNLGLPRADVSVQVEKLCFGPAAPMMSSLSAEEGSKDAPKKTQTAMPSDHQSRYTKVSAGCGAVVQVLGVCSQGGCQAYAHALPEGAPASPKRACTCPLRLQGELIGQGAQKKGEHTGARGWRALPALFRGSLAQSRAAKCCMGLTAPALRSPARSVQGVRRGAWPGGACSSRCTLRASHTCKRACHRPAPVHNRGARCR